MSTGHSSFSETNQWFCAGILIKANMNYIRSWFWGDPNMMDPLLMVPPLLPSSVMNVVSCSNQSNRSAIFKDEQIIKENVTISEDDLKDLVEFFAKTLYKAKDPQPKVLPNTTGELSSNYPCNLLILESEKDPPTPVHSTNNGASKSSNNGGVYASTSQSAALTSNLRMGGSGLSSRWRLNSNLPSRALRSFHESNHELSKLKDLCGKARRARCRARFPVPVILYKQKHICRSATLSGGAEIYGRSSFDYFFSSAALDPETRDDEDEEILTHQPSQSDWQLFDRVRNQDIRLLKTFQVDTIVDLMVEKKKVKFGMYVTSSEKVDKENRYAGFDIVSLPYPGCEFFKQYRDNGYCAERLIFDWKQPYVDADISVPSDLTSASINLDWSKYRDWDLVVLSQNYLKLLVGYLRDRDSGLLIHCISGWDRTPLFISLLRLSLWADGAIHTSLDADQILYLTLAYDWLLFGHNLEDRVSKGEDILFFCFNFLKYIVDPQYSINNIAEVPKPMSRVRNDSDVHLEGGVLLHNEGSHTNPEGSNWSLSSSDSAQSTRSQELAPDYFQFGNDSWEETITVHPQHLSRQSENGSNHSLVHDYSQYPKCTTNGSLTDSCLISTSMMSSTPATPTPPHETGGGGFSKSLSPNTTEATWPSTSARPIPNSIPQVSARTPSLGENGFDCGSPVERTSPVAVPLPNRLHLNNHTRHESNSSASMGSWQLISDANSLKENALSSVPGSSHSHPSRLSANLDCVESSESSCTLVEDLTPIESQPSLVGYSSLLYSDQLGSIGGSTQGLRFDEELGLALEESFRNERPIPGPAPPTSLDLMSSSRDDETVITASTTPTKEQEDEDVDVVDGSSNVFTNNNNEETTPNSEPSSQRTERLDRVRSRFHALYQETIQAARIANERAAAASSGLGLTNLFGNLATKVGMRSATSRTTTTQV